MKFFGVLSVAIAVVLFGESIGQCDFRFRPWYTPPNDYTSFYACFMTNFSIPDESFELDLSGHHLQDMEGRRRSNDDVDSIEFQGSNVKALPSVIFDTFKNLRIVNVLFARLERVEPGTLRNCDSLEILYFANNNLTKLENGVFKGCSKLSIIQVSSNPISELDDEIFVDTPNLRELDLSDTQLSIVPENALKHLAELRIISLARNEISTLPLCTFHPMRKINTIRLSDNKLEQIPAGVFSNLLELRTIHLNNNLFKTFEPGTFAAPITSIWLGNNQVETLRTNFFEQGRLRLEFISLFNNQINATEPTFFDNMPRIITLGMLGNICFNGVIYFEDGAQTIKQELKPCFDNFEGV